MRTFISALLTLSTLTASVYAGVENVTPVEIKVGDTYVKNTLLDKQISFEQCRWAINDSCTQIGPKATYSVEKLLQQTNVEYKKILGDVLLDLFSFQTHTPLSTIKWTATKIANKAPKSTIVVGTALRFASHIASPTLLLIVDSVDNVKQTKDVMTLGKAIKGEDTEVASIEHFIDQLETILSKI